MNSASAEAQREPDSSAVDDDRAPTSVDPKATLEDGLDAAYDFLRRQIAERPITVLAAALGAGLLLGAILSDRR